MHIERDVSIVFPTVTSDAGVMKSGVEVVAWLRRGGRGEWRGEKKQDEIGNNVKQSQR